jgi:hypothetical protein
MAYTKTVWKNRGGTFLNRYNKLNETATSVELVNTPVITSEGTPFNIEDMNHLEQGVADAHQAISNNYNILTAHADEASSVGRNLLDVLEVATVPEAMAALRVRCNGSETPNFGGLLVGDYLDIPSITIDGETHVFNNAYKNTRVILSGFNTYRGFGDPANSKNYLSFVFYSALMKRRMNPSSNNAGGYSASELRAFLEGTNGDGTGDYAGVTTAAFLSGLRAALGDYLHTIRLAHSVKGGYKWDSYTVFIPSEPEVLGNQTYGDELNQYNTNVQFPIYRSGFYRIKRLNGNRMWWWLQTPSSLSELNFCYMGFSGYVSTFRATEVGGVAPAFCIA